MVRLTLSCSIVLAGVAAGAGVVVAVGTIGFWVDISVSGVWDVDRATSFSLVVFSDVAESLVVVAGTAVVSVAVGGVGAGRGAGTVVRREIAVVVSACIVVLAVVTKSADVVMVVVRAPDVVVVLGVTFRGLRVASVTLVVDLLVVVILGVTVFVKGTLGVVLRVVVCVMLVAVAIGVALEVDSSRVVTLSRKVVGLGAAVEVVVCSGDQDGGGAVVAVVDTSTLPVSGCAVSVIIGLRVLVTTPGGVSWLCFLAVVAVIPVDDITIVVLAVVVVAATGIMEVTTGFEVAGR